MAGFVVRPVSPSSSMKRASSPETEPGPSLLEVYRQYLPFVAAILSIALGPQLAVKLRSMGRKSSGAGGGIFYRLVLGAILMGLVVTLLQWIITTGGTPRWMYILLPIRQAWLIAAAVLYVASFLALEWAPILRGAFTADVRGALQLAGLFILLRSLDLLQVNEDEMAMMAPDSMALAATALHAGTRCLVVTRGRVPRQS